MASEGRNLTDADVEAISAALEKRLANNFYQDLGKGVFGIVKKVIFMVLVVVAGYGAMKGIKP